MDLEKLVKEIARLDIKIISGYVVTRGIEKFNGYDQIIYRATRIHKKGAFDNLMAFKMSYLKELIKRLK